MSSLNIIINIYGDKILIVYLAHILVHAKMNNENNDNLSQNPGNSRP